MPDTWSVWTSHDKVREGRWSVLVAGLSQQAADADLAARQARVTGNACRFQVLPEGETP
jgi:hypothetical protein